MWMDHIERQRWVEEIGLINERLNKEAEGASYEGAGGAGTVR
jgi:hypothetical protein